MAALGRFSAVVTVIASVLLLVLCCTGATHDERARGALASRGGDLTTWNVTNLEQPVVVVHHKRKRKGKRRKKKRKHPVYNRVSFVTTTEPTSVVQSTIIRTSDGDHPGNRLLIERLRTSTGSEVRYYPNYPHPPTRGQFSRHRTGVPRYDSHYSNWRGLKYGCACDVFGSEHTACDIVSGQCACKENVTGRACDICLPQHWNLGSGVGCEECNCHQEGSVNGDCDVRTGQCVCQQGVGGQVCDKCLPGYYGFSTRGCSRCQECHLEGHVCDPATGRCVCPPYAQGPRCETCVANTYNFTRDKGCVPCECDPGGSVRPQCNASTGQCECRKGFRGPQCGECDVGFYGFPVCKSCDCTVGGTVDETCDVTSGRCGCNSAGQCQCKANVVGDKCGTCKPGTFGIQPDNPNGCTACFCFGRSASCTQAGLQWTQIRSGRTRSVAVEYDPSPPFKNTLPIDTQEICYINLAIPGGGEVTLNGADRGLNVTNNLRTIPGDAEDVKIGVSFLFDTPVYWQLPKQFLGDKVLSYGGFLRFTVETEGSDTRLPPGVLSTYPLVQLQGNSKIVLEHFPLIPSPTGHYNVRFHESLWKEKHPNRKVSRETLMVALQNIQHILIRASDSVDFTKLVLKDVSMDTAAVAANGVTATAGGVEVCECPPEYNSTSCQNPSIGFYRWYNKSVHSATILIQLVGEARPCECNGRSQVCDIETGYCQGCSDNTGGPHCDRCGEGHYGDPARGPCLPCPCPARHRNFALSCQVVPGRDPVCICKEGYTGRHCDRCAYGWFGYPEHEGGSCQPCECDPYGSVSDECHEKTGQCNCRPSIEGKDCSICPARRVLTPKGCSTCEDGCTGVLIKEFDNLTLQLDRELGNIGSDITPPWKKLTHLETTAGNAEDMLEEWEDTSRDLENLIANNAARDLEARSRDVLRAAVDLSGDCEEAAHDTVKLKDQATTTLNKILDVRKNIERVVDGLGNYTNSMAAVVSDSAALMEARRLLEKIAVRYSGQHKQRTEHILDYCTGVLNKTLQVGRGYPEIEDMREQLQVLLFKLQQLEELTNRTIETSSKKKFHIAENKKRYAHLSEKVETLNSHMEEIENIHVDVESMLDESERYIAMVEQNTKNLTEARQDLKNQTLALERREGILYELNPMYRTKYVKPAQEHAALLMRKAKAYRDLFNATTQDASSAVEASKAYQDIVDGMKTARESAEYANVSADISYKQVFPSDEDSVVQRAIIAKSVSSRLAKRGQLMQDRRLRNELERQMAQVDRLGETIRKAGEADNNVSRSLQELQDLKVGDKVMNVIDRVDTLESKLDEAKESVQKISRDVANKLRPRLQLLATEAKHLDLEKGRQNIRNSLAANQRAADMLKKLTAEYELRQQRQTFRAENQSLSDVLMSLKNKITEARHAAQSILLSLTSNSTRGCVRAFRVPTLEPTTTTRLTLTLSVNPSLRNGVIFYLPSSTSSDYMGVELVNGIVRFLWNNGGGAGVVWKALNEDPYFDPDVDVGHRWYKIVIERTSYTARLWVVPGGFPIENIPPATNASDPKFGRMDLGPEDRVWIGGMPPNHERPPEFQALRQGLVGCLHSVILDERPIGLWSFFTDTSDSCSACEKGAEEAVDQSMYNFNGDGYAVLKHVSKATYNKYQFSMGLKFKTYDDNAHLFLAVGVDKDRYVSLTLKDGRVIFQIGYGPDSQLEMGTTRKYNDGNWTTLEASRSFDRKRGVEKGLLKVGDEMKEAAPPTPPVQSQIPELSGADYLVGGVPPGYDFGSLHLRLPKSFLGCMTELFIDKELYNPLRGRNHGVRSSCSGKVIKVAGFHGNGYLRLEASNLNKKAAFGLALRTLQADALILLANGKTVQSIVEPTDAEEDVPNEIETGVPDGRYRRESYYSISLVDGRVEVRIDAGMGAVTLVSQTLCNDGRFHSISVTKNGRQLELRVDDEFQASSELPDGRFKVRVKDLYLGGTPKYIDPSPYVSDFTPFVGTIKNVLFNYVLQKFDKPVSFSAVDLGRLGPEKGDNSIVSTFVRVTAAPHTGCHRSRKYVLDPKAVKFGDSPHSHVQVNLRRRGVFSKNYVVELDFRTFYPNGLLFMIPGATRRSKQKHFTLLTLKNGQVQVIVKAKRKVELSNANRYNDGVWHHVTVSREDRNLSIIIDGGEAEFHPKFPKKVNLGNTIYVGGLPESLLLLPDNFISRLEGFKGCVRNLKISNQTEDLIGEKSHHQRVGQCFPNVERGSYFSGDAYAVHKKEYNVESLLQIELEFRTSEMSGMLLSIVDSPGYPAFSLEIHNGKILLSGDIGDRRQFQLAHEFPSQFTVCDDKWHRAQVMYDRDEVVLRVDQVDEKLHLPRTAYFMNANITAPLHIGGLPDHGSGGKPLYETRDNFKGCLRSFVIGGERMDWTKMDSLHNVLIGSCPAVTLN